MGNSGDRDCRVTLNAATDSKRSNHSAAHSRLEFNLTKWEADRQLLLVVVTSDVSTGSHLSGYPTYRGLVASDDRGNRLVV